MKEMQKSKIMYVVAIILACALVASLVLSGVTLNKLNSLSAAVMGNENAAAQENDVVIGGEYTIKSTENISDAYISGDKAVLSDRDKETLDMAAEILDGIIEEGMSPYEKELAVYEWMTGELKYDAGALLVIPTTGADSDNPYGVLKYHNAVCVGYATTFRLFMQMLGIECMVVHNSELYHSWNLVKLDNEWYHTDIYSDVDYGNYANFNMSDSQMAETQSWDTDFFPAATGYKYSYAYQNMTGCADIYDIPSALREMFDNMEGVRAFCFDSEITEEQAQIVEMMFENICSLMMDSQEFCNLWMDHNWLSTDKGYVLCVYASGYDMEEDYPTYDIPDEAYEKIDDAVSSSFGDLTPWSGDDWEDGWDDGWYEEAVG